MKTTLREKIKKRLFRFGRKNGFCRILAFPLLVFFTLIFHVTDYCRGNLKRFSMLVVTFCLFATYSSFSFPLFISGNGRAVDWDLEDADSDVELAPESELRLEDMEILSDTDVLEEYELEEYEHPREISDEERYDTSDILASLEGRGNKAKPEARDILDAYESGELVFDRDDWRLVLLNKQHSIPDDYTFTLGNIGVGKRCDERILDDLADMVQAAKDDGINLVIVSSYRTPEHQVELFERKIRMYMNGGLSYMEAYQLSSRVVNVPGNSEHEVGLALDIVCDTYTKLEAEFENTDAGKWLAENSCRFGFILRYPEEKEYVTGISYEPWHFRYVGVEAATVITEQGITLEELWETL
ncbi:MAG: M15 family metallopeptidase [Clostridium sp.]|nr:M15 family metallopeptidase [Acetatifactor muris]MCM1527133.1 M15 family metallopeptidase [Bacteroides sp.]MCM1563448.1 M15 family metallopeptidase [Clostridium sp.]